MSAGLMRIFVLRDYPHVLSMKAFIENNWKALAEQEKPLQVVVTPYKAKRTLEQNAKLHAVLQEISEKAWVGGRQFTMEAWKAEFAKRLIGTEDLPGGGSVPISTTTLDVESCAKFIDQMEAIAATELGVEFSA